MWWLAAIVASWMSAGTRLVNQFYKIPGEHFTIWRSTLHGLLLAPALFFIDFPKSPVFYMAVLGGGVLATFIDIRSHNASSRFGGGLVSRIMPLSLIPAFFIWFLFDPNMITKLLNDPLRATAIFSCICGIAFFTSRMQKNCEISRQGLIYLLPVVVASSLIGSLNKTAMMHTDILWHGIVAYIFIQSIIIGPLTLVWGRFSGQKNLHHAFLPHSRNAGLLAGFSLFFYLALKNYAMRIVPHPTYVTAIERTAAFWIILFYRAIKHKEVGDVKNGLLVVALVITMILLIIL